MGVAPAPCHQSYCWVFRPHSVVAVSASAPELVAIASWPIAPREVWASGASTATLIPSCKPKTVLPLTPNNKRLTIQEQSAVRSCGPGRRTGGGLNRLPLEDTAKLKDPGAFDICARQPSNIGYSLPPSRPIVLEARPIIGMGKIRISGFLRLPDILFPVIELCLTQGCRFGVASFE